MSAATLLARIKTGTDLDAQTFPPLSWAVPGLVPEGFGLFVGAPKTGKSWATLGLALAVASGGRAMGKVPVGEPRPVLLLALEDGERRLQERCRQLLDGEPIPALFQYITVATPAEVPELIAAWLEQHGAARPLVVLDTLGKVMPPAHPGEGAYGRDYRIGGALKRLVDVHPGASLLGVHHTRKAAADDWMDGTSGTNGLNGSADFTVTLSRARNEPEGVLRVTGRDVPEGEYAIRVADGSWSLVGDDLGDAARSAQQVKVTSGLGDLSARVAQLVGNSPRGVRADDVAHALDITAKDAGTYLGRLERSGRIRRIARGLYGPQLGDVLPFPSTRGYVGSEGSVGTEDRETYTSHTPTHGGGE